MAQYRQESLSYLQLASLTGPEATQSFAGALGRTCSCGHAGLPPLQVGPARVAGTGSAH